MELHVEKVTKAFVRRESRKDQVKALNQLSLTVYAGQIYGLLGVNGAGKSTLLNCISTILAPDGGRIIIKKVTAPRVLNLTKNPNQGRKHIIFCFQDPKFDMRLTVGKNLAFHARMFGLPREAAKKEVKGYLQKFQLWERRDERIHALSGGMKKQLENIRGFIIAQLTDRQDKLFIIDEPTAYCDVTARHLIWQELLVHVECGGTILFSTNDLSEAEELTDRPNARLGFIKGGKIIVEGSLATIKHDMTTVNNINLTFSPDEAIMVETILPRFQDTLSSAGLVVPTVLDWQSPHLQIQEIPEASLPKIINHAVGFFSTENIAIERLERHRPSLNELFVQ